MRLKNCLLLPLTLTLSIAAFAQSSTDTNPSVHSSTLDSSLFYQLLIGELSARGDEPAAGFSLLLDAARKTNDERLFRRTVQIALQVRSGESALMAAKAWSEAQRGSKEANHFVLQILLGLNRTAETAEPLKREIALSMPAERPEILWSIPTMFEGASDQALAATTVRKVLSPYMQDAALGATAWAVLGRMALSAGDKASALSAAARGITLNAHSEYPALLALALMGGDVATAELLLQKHLPYAKPEFRLAYVKVLLNLKREADANAQLEALRAQTPDYPDTWLILGALALQNGRHEDARELLQRYLELTDSGNSKGAATVASTDHRRGRSQAFLSLAQIAQLTKDYAQAEMWLSRVDDPKEVLRAQIRRAALMAQQGHLDAALEVINAQQEFSESDVRIKRSSLVQLLKDHQQFSQARDLLQSYLAENPDDPDLIYDLAMLYEKSGELADMERLLRQLIAARPSDPQAYNALGYALADRGLRLTEAKALIAKAVELAPKDAYISDSLAWVEFRLGNHSVALTLLQNAFLNKPDAEIAAHLGEVLWTMKQSEQALQIWRDGLKLAPDNETLLETLKRLQVKL